MSRTIWVGAVAYDPKVVTIWEGMRRYFHEEAHLAVEVVLFQSYEAQVAALLACARRAAAAHRHRMEYEPRLSAGRCMERPSLPTDRDARHRSRLDDQDRRGDRGSGRHACRSQRTVRWRSAAATAAMPRSSRFIFWSARAWLEGKDYRTLRFNSDVGKHGDTGTSEVEVVRAVLDGRADAGAIGSPFWNARAQPSAWCRKER